MTHKATVITHSGDFDGEFCREIAKKFLGADGIEYVCWDYKDPKLDFPAEGQVYVLDLNPECFKEFPGIDVAKERVIWIDHHKTAIDKWGTYLPGYRIDGVAACRLTWQWFTAPKLADIGITARDTLPNKEQFTERKVSEPLSVLLAGEYDCWIHRGDGDLEFQLGLRAQEEIPWSALLDDTLLETQANGRALCANLIKLGRMIQIYVKKGAAIKMQDAFLIKWRGLTWLALNDASKGSQTFESRDVPNTGHDALMRFYWTGKAWEFSLYHASHRTDLDLSEIAKAYGGGGHAGAAGCRIRQIPFPLYPQD